MRPLLQRPLAVLALCTSGLDPQRDGIWELALLLVDEGVVTARHYWRSRPTGGLPREVAAASGVLPCELDGSPPFSAHAEEVRALLQGRLLVGHDLRRQLAFLRREVPGLRQRQLCLHRLSRALHPDWSSHDFDRLCAAAGVMRLFRLRAQPDAELAWQCLRWLLAHPETQLAPALASLASRRAVPVQLESGLLAGLPQRPGVYYFHAAGESDEPGALLYVGKSIDLRARIASHFRNDHASRRSLQIARQVAHIHTRTTAGELGALLLEASEIARLQPLYNRQLRRQRQLLSWLLPDAAAGVQPQLVDFRQIAPQQRHAGLFRNPRQAKEWLAALARERGLCPRLLGLEKGRGACFASHLSHCRGACCGRESREAHDARLLDGAGLLQLAVWPWPGPVALIERDAEHGQVDWLVLDQWRWLGTATDAAEARALLQAAQGQPFSRDSYRILRHWLRAHPDAEVVPLCAG